MRRKLRFGLLCVHRSAEHGSIPYFPRFKHRDPKEAVSHPTLLSPVPSAAANKLLKMLLAAFEEAGIDPEDVGLKLLRPENMHVTFGWINPGNDRSEDLAQLTVAREWAQVVHETAKEIAPITLVANGFAVLRNQIVVMYRAEGWNQVNDAAALIRSRFPELDKGAIPLV